MKTKRLVPGLDQRQLRSVLAHAPHPIWVKDRSGRYTFVNRAFELVLGVREEDVLGHSSDEILPGPLVVRALEQDQKVLESGASSVCEESTELDGVGQESVVVRFPIFDEHGAIIAVGGIATDVTRQSRARRQLHDLHVQLHQTQRLQSLGALANGIVHDFNNILLAITGYVELARRSLPEAADTQPMLAEALAAATRARELIGRLADFSRQEQPVRQPLQILQLVDEALRLLSVSAPPHVSIRGPRREAPPGTGNAIVLGDCTQILQVIMNLCVNAVQAMPDGGVLHVTLDERVVAPAQTDRAGALHPGPHAVLTVADTGCGMDGKVLARIFDPYFTTKPRGQGSGLGLAVVRGIVEAHAGEIRVDSVPGRGTRFEVWLPTEDVYAGAGVTPR